MCDHNHAYGVCKHDGVCKHECLHYCVHCDKVYCCKCGQEWSSYQWHITYPDWNVGRGINDAVSDAPLTVYDGCYHWH